MFPAKALSIWSADDNGQPMQEWGIYNVQVQTMLAWLPGTDGFLELLKCWQLYDVLRKTSLILQSLEQEA